jgi:putative hydrolase of the HAD superfamily
MENNGITDVFFDLDHTLWDFEKNSALTFERLLKSNQVPIDLDDFLKVYVPANLAFWKLYREEKITKEELRYQRLKSVFDKLGYTASDDLIFRLADQYIQYLSSYNHLFPNAVDILAYLQPKYRLHIITNGFEEVQNKKMKNSKIYGYFDQIINSEMAGVKKPNPIIFELALKNAKTTAETSMMIGDSLEADILGAKDCGFHTIHFNGHHEELHEICPIIHDLSEIKNFL